MKTETKTEIKTETINQDPLSPDYSGIETVTEPTIDGKWITFNKKMWLSGPEVKKFMGDHDPSKYFREGKVPIYLPQSLGRLVDEDAFESKVKRDVFSKYPGVLMFKHERVNIYTLLIPKELTEHEFMNGEFVERLVRYDARSIVCTGGARPSEFTEAYFKEIGNKIIKHLDKAAESRKVY